MSECAIKPVIEIFDTGMIGPGIQPAGRRTIKEPIYCSCIMGVENCQEASAGSSTKPVSMMQPPKSLDQMKPCHPSIYEATGNSTRKVFIPPPLSAQILPRCSWTMRWAMDSPSP